MEGEDVEGVEMEGEDVEEDEMEGEDVEGVEMEGEDIEGEEGGEEFLHMCALYVCVCVHASPNYLERQFF